MVSARLFLQTTITLVDILSSINMFKKVFRLRHLTLKIYFQLFFTIYKQKIH